MQARWNYVLDNMVEQDWLDKTKREAMKFPVPKEPKAEPGMEGQTGYLVDAANSQLEKQLVSQGTRQRQGRRDPGQAGGWTITLNIDKKKQAQLEKSVKSQLTSKLDPKKRRSTRTSRPVPPP